MEAGISMGTGLGLGMFFDWTMILLIPGIVFAMIAQAKVKSTFAKYSKVYSVRNVQAQQVVGSMLRNQNIYNVRVQPIGGDLTDNYNPANRTLNLSQSVYGSTSIASIGVAAHEAGHAIQHGTGYKALMMRSFMYPAVKIGSTLAWPIFIFGMIFSFEPLLQIGITAFAITVIFTLVTLPVEFNASNRAVRILETGGYLSTEEVRGARKVLNAAALTYVAAAVSALLQLLRLVLIARRRR